MVCSERRNEKLQKYRAVGRYSSGYPDRDLANYESEPFIARIDPVILQSIVLAASLNVLVLGLPVT